MIKGLAYGSELRFFAAYTKDTVQEAARIHKTSPVCSAALGRLLTAAAMMGWTEKNENDHQQHTSNVVEVVAEAQFESIVHQVFISVEDNPPGIRGSYCKGIKDKYPQERCRNYEFQEAPLNSVIHHILLVSGMGNLIISARQVAQKGEKQQNKYQQDSLAPLALHGGTGLALQFFERLFHFTVVFCNVAIIC